MTFAIEPATTTFSEASLVPTKFAIDIAFKTIAEFSSFHNFP